MYGERIQILRGEKGRLQKELAGYAGISDHLVVVFDFEKGLPQTISKIAAVARALGVPYEAIAPKRTLEGPLLDRSGRQGDNSPEPPPSKRPLKGARTGQPSLPRRRYTKLLTTSILICRRSSPPEPIISRLIPITRRPLLNLVAFRTILSSAIWTCEAFGV